MTHQFHTDTINPDCSPLARSVFGSARRLGVVFMALLLAGFMAKPGNATTIALQMDSGTAFSILGVSCGGIQQQDFSTGFDASGNISGEIYLQTRCGSSGRGGGYTTTTYSSWVGVNWDLTGALVSNTKLTTTPTDYSASFFAFDAQGDKIYNQLTALNVAPGQCAVDNTTYCTYQAFLDTAVSPTPLPGSIWLLCSGLLLLVVGNGFRRRVQAA